MTKLGMLADWVEGKRLDKYAADHDLIVMGDFNIPSRGDPLFEAVTRYGLQIPNALVGLDHDNNLEKTKRYDQILNHPNHPENFNNAGGVLDFYIAEAHIRELFPDGLSEQGFTFQLSDHLPLWIQISTDIDGRQLMELI